MCGSFGPGIVLPQLFPTIQFDLNLSSYFLKSTFIFNDSHAQNFGWHNARLKAVMASGEFRQGPSEVGRA